MSKHNNLTSSVFFVPLLCGAICFGPTLNFKLAAGQTRPNAVAIKRYSCPMHPEVISTKPGKCPKCAMALRAVESTGAASASVNTQNNSVNDDTLSFTSSRIPDVPILDQHGKRLNFFSDLVKGKTVAINFIFTTCTTICPPLTATFRRIQQDLATSSLDVRLISISVDPVTDTPERLKEFAGRFRAGPGWTFVTGDKTEISSLLRAFGAETVDKNDHTPTILIGNDATGYWTRAYGLGSPKALQKIISEVASRK